MISDNWIESRCIFCRNAVKDVGKLTDEHIVPHALGGNLKLKDATCENCRAITSKFETRFIKGPFNAFRFAASIQSRSRRQPETQPIFAVNGVESARIEIPKDQYPAMLTLPRFKGAALLDDGRINALPTKPWCAVDWESAEKVLSRFEITSFASIATNVYEFSRLIAKIAHCWAISEVGLAFSPLLCEIITEELGDNFRKYIRSRDNQAPDSINRELTHKFELSEHQIGDVTLLVGHVTLFSNLGAPTYDVVVGQKGSNFLGYAEIDAEDINLLPEHRIESYRFDVSRPSSVQSLELSAPPVDVFITKSNFI